MIIAVDFDGTCVTHDYPQVGREIGAPPVLRELYMQGHKLILWTMRSGTELQEAVDWFSVNEIPLFGINNNPQQQSWTESPKAYAHIYIDDAALGAPLRTSSKEHRPYIDWDKVRDWLHKNGALS